MARSARQSKMLSAELSTWISMANIYQRYQEIFNTIFNNELNLSNNCRRFVQMFPRRNVFQFQSKLRRRNVSMFQPRHAKMFQSLPMFQSHKNSASGNQGNKGGRVNVTLIFTQLSSLSFMSSEGNFSRHFTLTFKIMKFVNFPNISSQ